MRFKGCLLILFITLTLTLITEAKKHGHKGHHKGGHKKHKGHGHKGHKSHGHKGHKGHESSDYSKDHGNKGYIHHTGIQHSQPQIIKPIPPPLIQSSTPSALYSPPFDGGLETGQIPTDEQVVLILDWLSKVGSTIDVFLRLQGTYPDESKEQRHLVKNVYPPLRVLLEAQHAHEFSLSKKTPV